MMSFPKKVGIRTAQAGVLLGLFAVLAWALSTGPSHGKTTAPGDQPGVACTSCHRGTVLNGGGGSVSIAFPNGLVYTPGETQTFTVTIHDPAMEYGFQMTARAESDPANVQAGNFTADSVQKVICATDEVKTGGACPNNGLQWIEQATPYAGDQNSFSVQWTAPASNIGNIHIYIAANAANGGPHSLADHIYSADYVLVAPPESGGAAPVIAEDGVVNGGSFADGIQPGSFVSIFGSNFTTAGPTHWDGSITDGVLPTTLAGITVSIDGRPAPISYVDASQINVLAPAAAATGPVDVVVSNQYGSSDPFPVQLSAAAPAFFTFAPEGGKYIAAQIALPVVPTEYEYLAPPGLLGEGTVSSPAEPGDIIVLYGTGFGPTNPAVDSTTIFSGAAPTASPVSVTIGGKPAEVQFAGISGAGLYQLNVVVPPDVPPGDQPVVATTSDGVATSQQVFIAVE
jgi:uncharacterized protein (TIGR03437 family)